MLKIFNKLNIIGTPKLFVLMILFFLSCLTSALGQNFSTLEIVEMININVLQMNILTVEFSDNDKPINWILCKGNTSFIAQGGNRNHALIEQIRGVGNIVKILQQGHNNRVGDESVDKTKHGVYQVGSRNHTEVEQFGNQNNSEALQYGNSNEINIVQHNGIGFFIDNKSCVNEFIVSQTGYGNYAIVNQTFYP